MAVIDLLAGAWWSVMRDTIRRLGDVACGPMGPEARLQKQVTELVRKRGGYVAKVHQSGFGVIGTPDLLCCYRSLFVALEVKNPNGSGRLTPAQARQLVKIQHAGGLALVVESTETVEALLDGIDERLGAIGHPTRSLTSEWMAEMIAPRMEATVVQLEDYRQ